MRASLQWQVGFSYEKAGIPEEFVPAKVPGAVQLDYQRAKGLPDFHYADGFVHYAWMEDVYWRYQATLPKLAGDRVFLVCGGVDYRFEVFIAGQRVYEHEGMFTPFEIDVTEYPQDALLEVLIHPAPKLPGRPDDRTQAAQSAKPAVSYGWDWHPRMVPLGIWEETYLEVRPLRHITDFEARYTLSPDRTRAQIAFRADTAVPADLRYLLADPDGHIVVDTRDAVVTLENPRLWWPNGHGDPALYTATAQLLDKNGDTVFEKTARIGFRSVSLEMYPGAWGEPDRFPMTRSNPPIKLTVNGKPIFAKGSNWVNPEMFPGIISRETYETQLHLACEAHFNLLRIWGGGIVNKDSFFDLCDEMGLMVWQEFPLACNDYEGTDGYLRVLDGESRSIIKRLRSRACLAIWCGGNELFNGWSGMTEQSLPLRLLNRNCYDLDPGRPFLYTSPLMGMGHGCYLFRYPDGREVYQAMREARCTAYTEFGVPSPSPVDTLRRVIPEDELFPPQPGGAYEAHHAFSAWGGDPGSWLCLSTMEHYFGPITSLEQMVAYGNWLQCEGYKAIFEEARRQKPRCSMAVNWCYQEPWYTAANNSLIAYPSQPKPAYYAARDACRPVCTSARIKKFSWRAGEIFDPQLWLLNDAHAAVGPGRVAAALEIGGEVLSLGVAWDYPGSGEDENLEGPTHSYTLPEVDADRMTLVLRVVGHPEYKSQYTLVYRR